MKSDADLEGSAGFINQRTVVATLVGSASIGVQVLVPLVWPQLDRRLGIALLLLCMLGLVAAVILLLRGREDTFGPRRRWNVVGVGQGWIEARVRNNAGDQLMVSWNAGAEADRISISATLQARSKPRQSEIVEIVFDVDGVSFEWDVPDRGEAEFALDGMLWRDVQAIKVMLAAMRQGKALTVSVPPLDLRASFTLEGAFDILLEAATLGEAKQAD